MIGKNKKQEIAGGEEATEKGRMDRSGKGGGREEPEV